MKKHMKKMLVILFTLLFSISVLIVISSAEDINKCELTKEEALTLLDKAYQIYCTTNETVPRLDGSGSYNEFFYDSEDKHSPYYVMLDETKLYGGSLKLWNEAVDETFTNTAAQKARRAYKDNNCPLFIEKETGIYVAWGESQRMPFFMSYTTINEIELSIIEENEDRVKAKVKAFVPEGSWETPATEVFVTCVFEKTPEGWRLGDCGYTDMITSGKFEWTPVNSPSTGDENVSRVWWLAGVSLAALVPAALLVQRRRRRED